MKKIFLSSWLREDGKNNGEINRGGRQRNRRRDREKEDKRREREREERERDSGRQKKVYQFCFD